VPGIEQVVDARARWLGHDLQADVTVPLNDNLSLGQANAIASKLQGELKAHSPALAAVSVRFATNGSTVLAMAPGHDGGPSHHHAPAPVIGDSALATGQISSVDTPDGERMRLIVEHHVKGLSAAESIKRPGRHAEVLNLLPLTDEVNPPILALRDNGIEVTAIHNHMLDDQPRAFFVHYWANDDAVKLAKALRAALDTVHVAPNG